MDKLHHGLISYLGKKVEINHCSYKEHTKICKTAKFDCKILQNAEDITLKNMQILYTFHSVWKLLPFSAETAH